MKIGKISSFGKLSSVGKWYTGEHLYPTNRIYFVHSGTARFGEFVFEAGGVYFIPESPAFEPIAEGGEPFLHSYADFALISPIKYDKVIFMPSNIDREVSLALSAFILGCENKQNLKRERMPSEEFYSFFTAALSLLVTRVAEYNGADFISDQTVVRALYIMNSRMHEEFTVSSLAEEVYMSEDGFIRRFSRIMGMTPYAYLKKLRLTTAEGMINDGESVLTAAHSVGYSDAASLLHAMAKEKRKTDSKQ